MSDEGNHPGNIDSESEKDFPRGGKDEASGIDSGIVPSIAEVTTKQTLLWVSPQTFVDHAQRVGTFLESMEARVAAIEIREHEATAREGAFQAKVAKQFEELRDEELVPFMTSVQAELDAVNTKVDALASRLDCQLEDHLNQIRENKQATAGLSARLATVETKVGVAERNISDLQTVTSQTIQRLEQGFKDFDDNILDLRARIKDAVEDIETLTEKENILASRTSDLENDMKSMQERAAKMTATDGRLRTDVEETREMLATTTNKLNVNLEDVRAKLELKIHRIEFDASAAIGPEIQTIRNMETDVKRLYILAEDIHRHDADDDPLVVHDKALRSLTRTVNSHIRILSGKKRSSSSSSNSAANAAPPLSTPPPATTTTETEYNGDDPLNRLKKPDYTQRLQSDTSLWSQGKLSTWRANSPSKVAPHGGAKPPNSPSAQPKYR
jgi:chromosome segregation ATPase